MAGDESPLFSHAAVVGKSVHRERGCFAGEVADAAAPDPNEHSALGLVELLLKKPARIETVARDEDRQWELIPRFLTIALAGYTLYTLAIILILYSVKPVATPQYLPAAWSRESALGLWFGYNLGLIAAAGVCLPSFYFYSLLAGIRISMVQIAGQVWKGSAATGVMLLGILPIYFVIIMGMIVLEADPNTLQIMLYYGLGLPALAGLWGLRSIFLGSRIPWPLSGVFGENAFFAV